MQPAWILSPVTDRCTPNLPDYAPMLLFLFLALTLAPEKVEPVAALSDPAASAAIVAVLEPQGYRASSGGAPLCDLWLRKDLPVAKKMIDGANYADLSESEFIGVIRFPNQASDFRGQEIRAGLYSMRYALLPNDGNHLGVAPARDFVLLVPLASDPDPARTFTEAELVRLGLRASGTAHPAVFSMVAAGALLPSVTRTADDYVVFAAKTKTATGADYPLAIVVQGVAPQ
ncbi:MAG TPA: hypothetical protein VEG30_01565 [Terriglobales bacterium]|nr:hypothetical protein [Terriglobales bacterium]